MPTFLVEMKETRVLCFRVEAAGPDEARTIAYDSEEPITDQFDERVFHSIEQVSDVADSGPALG